MFEGKPPVAPEAHHSVNGEVPQSELCELSWSELAAKLAAARELRASLAGIADSMLASFDAGSARHLALHHESMQDVRCERSVNPDDLGNGKGECGKDLSGAVRKQPAIRGNT